MESDEARLITSDIDNFWRAFDLARDVTGEERIRIFATEYLDKGTKGLEDFIRMRIENPEALVKAIDHHPGYYRSVRESTLRIAEMTDEIRSYFLRLNHLYPDSVFPDVFFVIGRMRTGGTTSDNGLLIGAEMYGRTRETPLEELGDWHKQVLKPVEDIPFIVMHELIHCQQRFPNGEMTLLRKSIDEGSADFLGELVAGIHINEHIHEYGNLHERELWIDFREKMNGNDHSDWLYNADKAKGRPADLGYFIGYKICESYYHLTSDKSQAVRNMLIIDDFEQFLQASGYQKRFD